MIPKIFINLQRIKSPYNTNFNKKKFFSVGPENIDVVSNKENGLGTNPSLNNEPWQNILKASMVKNMINLIMLDLSIINTKIFNIRYDDYIDECDKFYHSKSDDKLVHYNNIRLNIHNDNHNISSRDWSFYIAQKYCSVVLNLLFCKNELHSKVINDKINQDIQHVVSIMEQKHEYWIKKPVCTLYDLKDSLSLKLEYEELKEDIYDYEELFGYIYFHSLIKLSSKRENNVSKFGPT